MTDLREMEAVVEAILFVASEPVPRNKIVSVFPEREHEAAEAAIEAVVERYRRSNDEGDGRGILLDEVAGGIRLVTRPELHGYLRKFFEISGTNKLSMAALETLAIVAYRQPITGPEIQLLRTRNPSSVLKTLLEKHLVRISGRKEVVGKPYLYSTTREFLMHFGLQAIKDLPPLEDFEEAFISDGDGLEAEQIEIEDREEQILREEAVLEDNDTVDLEEEPDASPVEDTEGRLNETGTEALAEELSGATEK